MDQYTRSRPPVRKLTGFRHFLAAAGYSLGGAKRAWQESAFRQEVGAGAGLAVAYGALGASVGIWVAATILFLMLLALEALNTAVEELVDRVSPELSATGRHAKDLGSFAVFCAICANGLLFLYVVADQFFLLIPSIF